MRFVSHIDQDLQKRAGSYVTFISFSPTPRLELKADIAGDGKIDFFVGEEGQDNHFKG